MPKKITDAQYNEYVHIATMYESGMKYKDIAAILGYEINHMSALIGRCRKMGLITKQRYTVIPDVPVQQDQSRHVDGYDVEHDEETLQTWANYYWSNMTIEEMTKELGVNRHVINYRHSRLKLLGYVPQNSNRLSWMIAHTRSRHSPWLGRRKKVQK